VYRNQKYLTRALKIIRRSDVLRLRVVEKQLLDYLLDEYMIVCSSKRVIRLKQSSLLQLPILIRGRDCGVSHVVGGRLLPQTLA